MGLKINSLFISLFFIQFQLFSQSSIANWKGLVIDKDNSEAIPYATIRVFSKARTFAFIANDDGRVDISYIYPTEKDSVSISCIGYKTKMISVRNLSNQENILLQADVHLLNEVVVRPRKVKKYKLGNLASFSIGFASRGFGSQMVLYIKNTNNMNAKVVKIRYYLKDFGRMGRNHYPFLVRIYEKDTINNTIGKDLLKENLIVSLNKGNWLEVDVSSYNIKLPQSGIFVGMEVLSKEYYISNNVISEETFGKYNIINTPSMGATRHIKNSENSFESWEYCNSGWTQKYNRGWEYLINIIVEVNR